MVEKKLKVGDLVMHSVEFRKGTSTALNFWPKSSNEFWGRGLGIIISFDEDGDPVVYFTRTGTRDSCYWQEITGVFNND